MLPKHRADDRGKRARQSENKNRRPRRRGSRPLPPGGDRWVFRRRRLSLRSAVCHSCQHLNQCCVSFSRATIVRFQLGFPAVGRVDAGPGVRARGTGRSEVNVALDSVSGLHAQPPQRFGFQLVGNRVSRSCGQDDVRQFEHKLRIAFTKCPACALDQRFGAAAGFKDGAFKNAAQTWFQFFRVE